MLRRAHPAPALIALLLALTALSPARVNAQAADDACSPENLVNGFLPLGRDDAVPDCPVRASSTALPNVYRVGDLPASFRETIGFDHVTYDLPHPSDGNIITAITISLRRTFNEPELLLLREASQAQPADFLPRPGVVIEPGPGLQIGQWIEPGGHYRIEVETELAGLTLDEVAARLIASEPRELGPYPPGTETGDTLVDEIVTAVLADDAASLHSRLQFTERPCSVGGGIGATSCPEGVPGGTIVPAVDVSQCEGWGATELPESTLADFAANANHLYTVARGAEPNERFVAVFGSNAFGASGTALGIGETGITHIRFGCAESAPELASRWPSALLPLRLRDAPAPPDTGSGLAGDDHQE